MLHSSWHKCSSTRLLCACLLWQQTLKVGLSIQGNQVKSVVQKYLLWLNTTKEHSQSVTDGNRDILAVAAPAVPTALNLQEQLVNRL